MNDFDLNEKAKKLIYKGKYKEALKLLEKIKDEDMLYKKLLNTGLCYHELKEYDKAIEKYEEAIKLAPDLDHAYSNLGTLYTDLKEYDKALEYHIKTVELLDYELIAVYNLILEYERRKEYDKIIELAPKINLEKQVDWFKKDYAYAKRYVYIAIGKCFYEKGDYENSIKYFEKVEKKTAYVRNYLVVNYDRLKDYKNALKYSMISIFRKPERVHFINTKKILIKMIREWRKH